MRSTDVIGVSDVLELLGLSLSTLERLLRDRHSGFPRPWRHGEAAKGRHRYWRRSDIAAYVERKARAAQVKIGEADVPSEGVAA
jgi:predicted DNA-binding transcriptional regulator AlpA